MENLFDILFRYESVHHNVPAIDMKQSILG